jgi:uncharacterized Zn finger protein
MCKHVAATLYGVGARLDAQPKLLFTLRGVNESDLLSRAGQDSSLKKPASAKVLKGDDVAALFGLDMAEAAGEHVRTPNPPNKSSRPESPTRRASAGPKRNRFGAAELHERHR